MQLKKPKKLSSSLAIATCSLLGLSGKSAQAEDSDWEISSSAFFYSEDDSRVTDLSAKAIAKKEIDEDISVTIGTQIDTLSGASPNGAVPASTLQTFSRPSGNGSYSINPGETPLDDTFQDTRLALSAGLTRQHNRLINSTVGGSVSKEYDYLHLGLNGSLVKESEDRNTSINGGLAISMDSYSPVGDAPRILSTMTLTDDTSNKDSGADTDKMISDVIIGVTQVLNRRAIAQVNYSFSYADGYLNDPYKVLSVVDGQTGELTLAADENIGIYRYENRPDTRTSHNLFTKLKYHLNKDIIDISYRYHTDDWDINSHTLDFRYRFMLNGDKYLEPHVRFYQQSAANFHHYFLTDTETPEFASADYRLAEFDATTIGLKFGMPLSGDKSFSTRLEYYQASGDDHPDESIGVLNDQDLYPEVSAWILQANYSFKF